MAKAINEEKVMVQIWKQGGVVKATYSGQIADDAAPDYLYHPNREMADDEANMVAAFNAVIADITAKDL